MPKITINRPNRKKKRTYSPCDVRRIVIYCLNDNPDVTTDEMLALIAKTLGYTHISTKKRDLIEDNTEEKQTSKLVDLLESWRNVIDDFLRGLGVDV